MESAARRECEEENCMEKWTHFPPTDEDGERLKTYSVFRKLMLGRHGEVYEAIKHYLPDGTGIRHLAYVATNFAGIISKLSADLLFGEAPMITVEKGQEALDEIIRENDLQTLCHTMALSASYRGDCVFKARYGKARNWDGSPRPIIEAVPSAYFFPEVDPNNIMGMTEAVIAWPRQVGSELYLRREIHQPGRIINELYRLDSENTLGAQVPLSYLEEYAGISEYEETGFPGLLVEYIPNWRLDDCFWGISDYFDILSLQEELNNRITKIRRILDRHSEPKLLLPPGIMQYDERLQRWYVEKEDLEAMEVDPEQAGDLPKYLTWEAQLAACFSEIDKLLDLLCMVTETAPVAIGIPNRDGGGAESGKALRFRLMRTLGKISRKERFFDQGLKNILFAAQSLNAIYGSGPAPEEVAIEWKDGLPDDPQETAEVINSRVSMKTMSLRRALLWEGLRGEALEAEIEEIEEASKSETVVPPPDQGVTVPEEDEEEGEEIADEDEDEEGE
jgi:hypothetical protein